MELFTIITVLTFFLSFMLQPCASSQHILVKSPEETDHGLQLTLPALPRKLKLIDEANVKAVESKNDRALQNKQEETLTVFLFKDGNNGNGHLQSKFHQKEADLVHAKKGTFQEWKEGADSSQFFTMDYTHVRRRRPIHNKFTPVAP